MQKGVDKMLDALHGVNKWYLLRQKYGYAYWDYTSNPTEENRAEFEKICYEVLEELMITNQEVLKRLKECKNYEVHN
jgi:hypothetical protein